MPKSIMSSTTNCNKCGARIAFCKSHKTGSLYPVNVVFENDAWMGDRTDFHSKTCTGVSQSPEEAVNMATAELDSTQPEDNDGAKWLDHPDVKKLSEQIAKIMGDVEAFEKSMEPISGELAEIQAEEDAMMEAMRKQIAEFQERKRAIERKRYEIRDQVQTAQRLKAQMDRELQEKVNSLIEADLAARLDERFNVLLEDNSFAWKQAIREFQMLAVKTGTRAILDGAFGYAILDQMGLGKTLEATALMESVQAAWEADVELAPSFVQNWLATDSQSSRAVLWVCPNSIKVTSEREIEKWAPEKLVIQMEGDAVARGSMVKMAHKGGAVLVVSYEQLRNRSDKALTPELFEYDWPIVVLDEAHRFKSVNSSTFENVKRLCERAGAVVPMTGTPILNRPDEFWAILHMMTLKGKYEGRFKDKWRFEAEYCGYTFNSDRLIKAVKDIVIRRRKDEVALELPDKERIVHNVELGYEDELRNYEMMREQFALMIDEDEGEYISAKSILAVFTRLRQLALWQPGVKMTTTDKMGQPKEITVDCQNSSKIDRAMEIIQELVDNGEKVLVFSNYNDALKEVQRRVHDLDVSDDEWTVARGGDRVKHPDIQANLIIGGQNPHDRARVVDEFNDPKSAIRILCGNIAAMGIGLNLQGACSNAIFLDMFWNPGINEQAEDRLHRGGQKNAVMIHYIQALDTIDGFIAKKVEDKLDMIEGIIERSELRQALDDGLI